MKPMPSARRSLRGALVFALGCSLGALNCGRTAYECYLPGESPTYELKCGGLDSCLKELSLPVDPPSVIIALDRSCSMKYLIDDRTKWEIATDGLLQALDAYPELWWGGLVFPDGRGEGCGQGDIPVRPGPDNSGRVAALLRDPASAPGVPCETNLGAAIEQVWRDEALREMSQRTALLLISDGQLGCGGGGSNADGNPGHTEMIQEMYEESGIQTFVIGFGDEVDAEVLNDLAEAGGAPAEGASAYYQADADDLVERVFEVLERHGDCEYEIELDPEGLDGLTVRIDGGPKVRRSSTQGWEYDAERQRLVFSGGVCRKLEAFAFETLDLSLDCRASSP